MGKTKIPQSQRVAVWLKHCGEVYNHKCYVKFCQKVINAHEFHVGHIVAEANGGENCLSNYLPICATCNLSMGTKSIYEYEAEVKSTPQCVRQVCDERFGVKKKRSFFKKVFGT